MLELKRIKEGFFKISYLDFSHFNNNKQENNKSFMFPATTQQQEPFMLCVCVCVQRPTYTCETLDVILRMFDKSKQSKWLGFLFPILYFECERRGSLMCVYVLSLIPYDTLLPSFSVLFANVIQK